MTMARGVAGLVAASLLAAGCSKQPGASPPESPPLAFRVTGVEVGTGLNPDKSIAAPDSVFGTRDTIFASVATEGSTTGATVRARFIFQTGQLVHEFTQPITASGPTHSEFHVWRAEGWPTGFYRVEVFLGSESAGWKEYEVKKP